MMTCLVIRGELLLLHSCGCGGLNADSISHLDTIMSSVFLLLLRDAIFRSDVVRKSLFARSIDQFIVERIEQEVGMMMLIATFECHVSRNKHKIIQSKTKLKWSRGNTRKLARLPGFSLCLKVL